MNLIEQRILDLRKEPDIVDLAIKFCSYTINVTKVDYKRLGHMMRNIRKYKKVSLRAHAAKMKISVAFLSDLELGRRNWPAQRLKEYIELLPDNPTAEKIEISKIPS